MPTTKCIVLKEKNIGSRFYHHGRIIVFIFIVPFSVWKVINGFHLQCGIQIVLEINL